MSQLFPREAGPSQSGSSFKLDKESLKYTPPIPFQRTPFPSVIVV